MTNLNNDQELYKSLVGLFHGAVLRVSEKCRVHRNTVRNVLWLGMASEKRQEIRQVAEDFIAEYSLKKVTEAQENLERELKNASRLIPMNNT